MSIPHLLLIVCIILIQSYAIASKAKKSQTKSDVQLETAINTIYLARFTVQGDFEGKTFLNNKIDNFQTALATLINRKSYFDLQIIPDTIRLQGARSEVKNRNKSDPTGGFLVGQFRKNQLRLVLIKSGSGRLLQSWAYPMPKILNEDSYLKLLKDLSDTFVTTLPYRGFVTDIRGSQVKINLGKNQALKVGEKLALFEFEGDSPNFESPKSIIGEVEIERVAPEAAIGKIKEGDNIPLYSKVDFQDTGAKSIVGIDQKYFDEPWISIGPSYLYVDSQTSDNTADSRQRQYQLTLSPFLTGGIGYRRLSLFGSMSSAKNASNSVSFLLGRLQLELRRLDIGRFGFTTSIGAGYSQYTSKTLEGAEFPLTSQTSYWPLVEQSAQMQVSPRSRMWLLGQVHVPKVTSDKINKTSRLTQGYGFRSEFGIRIMLSDVLGVENALFYDYSQWTFPNNRTLAEGIFGFNLLAIGRF